MAVTQSHFRFGVNELTEATHGWYVPEDTSPGPGGVPVNTTFLLRYCLQCDGTAQSNIAPEFQFRVNEGAWTNITTTSSVVRATTTVAFANGANTTKRLSGTGTFEATSAGCTTDGTSGGAAFDIVANGNGETECAMQLIAADLSAGANLEFRLTRNGGVLLDVYAATPRLQIQESVQRPRIVTGPFPFPKTTPDWVPSVASPDVTVGLTGLAAATAIGAIGATLAFGLSGVPAGTATGSMSGNFAVYPEVERPKVVTGPFPFPKSTPAFKISSPDREVFLDGVQASITQGILYPPFPVFDRPVYVIGPAPFLESGPFKYRQRARDVFTRSDVTTAGPLSSATLTASRDTLTPVTTVALIGHQATGSTGTILTNADGTGALTSTALAASLGTLTPGVAQPISGHEATSQLGSLAASSPGEVTLSGLRAITSLGSMVVITETIPAVHGRGSYHRRIPGAGSYAPTILGKGSTAMQQWHIDEDDDFFVGEDKQLIHTTYQSDKRRVQNITGWALSWMLKRSLSDADVDAVLTKTSALGGITLTTPASGISTITILDTDTDAIPAGRYFHEVKRIDAGNETVLSQGRCVLRQGVHRS